MIKSFETQLAFETWLGDNVLPSKTIAYVAESKEYFLHTNNMGVDEVISGTYDVLKGLDSVPMDVLQEIEVYEQNLNPVPPVPSDLEGRVENLEEETLKLAQKVTGLTPDEDLETVTYRRFNAGFIKFGWVRTTGEFGPGVPTYYGLGLTAVTKFREESGVKYYTLLQLFFNAGTYEVHVRYADYTVYEDGSTMCVFPQSGWKVLGGGTYSGGTGISVSSNDVISINPNAFKTVAGQVIVGEGDITVGVDEELVRQITNDVCDERIGNIETALSYILGDVDAELAEVLGDE